MTQLLAILLVAVVLAVAQATTNSTEALKQDGYCDAIVFSGCENTSVGDLMGVKFVLGYEGGEPQICDTSPTYSYAYISGGRSLFTMSGSNGKEWFLGTSGRPCMSQAQWFMRSNSHADTYTSDPSTSDPGLWTCWDETLGWVDGLRVECVSRS
jgi:hypothetical protein